MKKFIVNKFAKVELFEPETIKVTDDNGSTKFFILEKEAIRFIYGRLKLSLTFSKNLYKISPDAWKTIINERKVNEDGEIQLDLNDPKMKYITLADEIETEKPSIVSVTDAEDFETNLENFYKDLEGLTYTELSKKGGYMTTLIVRGKKTDEASDEVNSIVHVDIDNLDGSYRVYNGVITKDGEYVLMPKPSVQVFNLTAFLESTLLSVEYSMSEKLQQPMLDNYMGVRDNIDTPLSIREVLSVLSQSGIVVNVDDDSGLVNALQGVDITYSQKFRDFFNSFDMPFKSLTKLSFLRKVLRTNSLTVKDMVGFLSTGVENNLINITGIVISEFLSKYYDTENDKLVIEEEMK